MAAVKWVVPSARSSNILSTVANSLANGSESAVVTYDNSTLRDLYAVVTLKLGSLTPSTSGSVSIRVTINDGTDTADKAGGTLYTAPLLSGTGAKVCMFEVRLPPFSLRLSVLNNAGVAFPASGNELYVRPWNEDVT